jgi:hypothetical protein
MSGDILSKPESSMDMLRLGSVLSNLTPKVVAMMLLNVLLAMVVVLASHQSNHKA